MTVDLLTDFICSSVLCFSFFSDFIYSSRAANEVGQLDLWPTFWRTLIFLVSIRFDSYDGSIGLFSRSFARDPATTVAKRRSRFQNPTRLGAMHIATLRTLQHSWHYAFVLTLRAAWGITTAHAQAGIFRSQTAQPDSSVALPRVLEYWSTTRVVTYLSNFLLLEYLLLFISGYKFPFPVAVFLLNCWNL